MLRATDERVAARLHNAYGDTARVQRIYGVGSRVLLGVALDDLLPDSDVVPAVAVASYDRDTDSIDVITREAAYREALPVGDHTALVTKAGSLSLLQPDGVERPLLAGVRGDLALSADGERLALTLGESHHDGDTAVAVTDLEGNVTVLADGQGVDDRPALSPDGETVVFVSGRTGIASFYRTTLRGDAPVQLTNVGIEAGIVRDADPAGFVPPPVVADRIEWLSDDVIRYDAGDGEMWTLDVRTGAGARERGVK